MCVMRIYLSILSLAWVPMLAWSVVFGWVSHDQASAASHQAQGMAVGRLRVGVVLPFTGSQADYGQEVYTGMQIAMTQIRAKDADMGHKIELVKANDRSSVSGVDLAVSELDKRRVQIYVGSVTEINSQQLVKLAAEKQKPVIVPVATTVSLKDVYTNAFMANYPRAWQGRLLAKWVSTSRPQSRVGVIYDAQSPFASRLVEQFVQGLGVSAAQLVFKEDVPVKERKYGELASLLVERQAGVLLYPSEDVDDVRRMLAEIDKKKASVQLLGVDAWGEPAFAQKVGGRTQQMSYLLPFSYRNEADPEVRWFTSEFVARLKRYPSAIAYLGYDSMMMAYSAFKQANSERSSELKRVLHTLREVPGLLGAFTVGVRSPFPEKAAMVVSLGPRGVSWNKVTP